MRILFIDTCTWLKLEILESKELFKISVLFSFSSIAITHEIKEELEYFSISGIDFKQLIIYPISDQILYKRALEVGFDEADASLLSNGRITTNDIFLISEDRAIISFGQLYKMNIMQLVDLFRILTTFDYIDKAKFYQLIKYLRNERNITKNKEKKLLNWLKSFK